MRFDLDWSKKRRSFSALLCRCF